MTDRPAIRALGPAFVAAVVASRGGMTRAENTERATVVTIGVPC
ncbi:hypothetical protein AB0D27_08080 [Streptomyces sp. NPDC048415]